MNQPDATGAGSGKLRRSIKTYYGLGAFGECIMGNGIMILALPIYSIALGLNEVWIGYALGIPRIWDALTDPLMGNISDNTRTRWGRRRPYIAAGALLSGVIFALLWAPDRQWSTGAMFTYFLAFSLLYFTAFTVFSIPYASLGFELTEHYHERTRVMSYKVFFVYVASLAAAFMYKLCFVFGGGDEVRGVRWVGVLYGALVALAGLAPAWGCRERPAAQTQRRIAIRQAVVHTLQNRMYLVLVAASLFMMVAVCLSIPFGTYLGMSYVFQGDREAFAELQIWSSLLYGLSGMAWTPAVAWLGTHLGKRRAFLASQVIVGIGYVSTWWLLTPANPYLGLISSTLVSAGFAGIHVGCGSMVADLCDLDELRLGLRREGSYAAVGALINKLGFGGTMIISGYLVSLTGYDETLTVQTTATTHALRVAYIAAPVALIGMAMVGMLFYRMTEAKFQQVRRILDRRHARQAAAERHP